MRRRFIISTVLSDLLALATALAVAGGLVFGTPFPWHVALRPGDSIWPLVGLLLTGAAVGSIASLRMWSNAAPRPSYGRALGIVSFTVAIASLGIVVARPYWSRSFLGISLVLWLAGALAHRAVRRRRPWTESVVIISGEKGMIDDLRVATHVDVMEVHDPAGLPPQQPIPEGTTLAVDLRAVLSDGMAQFVSSSVMAGYNVRAFSSLYEEHTGRLALVHLSEGWEVSAPLLRNGWYAPFKRSLDVLLVLATTPLWLILAAFIWVAVRLDSPGPVIYRQQRYGYDGKVFTLYKFRTMEHRRDNGPRFTRLNDERLTRTGRVLRRYRIDEIPQLWNVLKGDLSLVGPRPEQVDLVHDFEESIPFYSHRHLVRPGVTGWAQVNYGYADDEADTIEKLTYDLYYVKHMSPWLDLGVLGQSIWTVLSGFGAQ